MTTYWCTLHTLYPIFEHGVAQYGISQANSLQHYGYVGLKNHWESSLRRAYDMSASLNRSYRDVPCVLVFEVEERGPRGVVYDHEPYYVAMFSIAARNAFKSDATGRRALAVADIEYTEGTYHTEPGVWYMPSNMLKELCLGYHSSKYSYDELVKRAGEVWHKWQAEI